TTEAANSSSATKAPATAIAITAKTPTTTESTTTTDGEIVGKANIAHGHTATVHQDTATQPGPAAATIAALGSAVLQGHIFNQHGAALDKEVAELAAAVNNGAALPLDGHIAADGVGGQVKVKRARWEGDEVGPTAGRAAIERAVGVGGDNRFT